VVTERTGANARASSSWVLLATVLGAAACFDVKAVDPGVEVLPDASGLVDPRKNELGISGHWYSYGDQYDAPSACTQVGMHDPEECSLVSWPPPLPSLEFPNRGGSMCTFGSVGMVVDCESNALLCAGSEEVTPKTDDFSNIWGAGIGLDFKLWSAEQWAGEPADLERDPLRDRSTWDASAAGVVGIAFDFLLIDGGFLGTPHLRVEFPMRLPPGHRLPPDKATVTLKQDELVLIPAGEEFPENAPSEEHPSGSPFWGAPVGWGDGITDMSPVREGHNVVRFSDVKNPPESSYDFDVTQLLGIQFHVPTLTADRLAYGFCISNLTFLRE
jgi:hypothetical protein